MAYLLTPDNFFIYSVYFATLSSRLLPRTLAYQNRHTPEPKDLKGRDLSVHVPSSKNLNALHIISTTLPHIFVRKNNNI